MIIVSATDDGPVWPSEQLLTQAALQPLSARGALTVPGAVRFWGQRLIFPGVHPEGHEFLVGTAALLLEEGRGRLPASVSEAEKDEGRWPQQGPPAVTLARRLAIRHLLPPPSAAPVCLPPKQRVPGKGEQPRVLTAALQG
ncbi:unnamed protein product [Rangifer tarandus platyrhynchus]|uniref:Uncharacterized protein n=1 Tax=Rangifer tarandus platyrhynchus TaxID=3082113 RepID=A0AC59Z684_RANTA